MYVDYFFVEGCTVDARTGEIVWPRGPLWWIVWSCRAGRWIDQISLFIFDTRMEDLL